MVQIARPRGRDRLLFVLPGGIEAPAAEGPAVAPVEIASRGCSCQILVQYLCPGIRFSLLQVLFNALGRFSGDAAVVLCPVVANFLLALILLLHSRIALGLVLAGCHRPDVLALPALSHVYLETVECRGERAGHRLMPHGAGRRDKFTLSSLDGDIFAQRLLERLLIAAELSRTFLNCETSIVAEDVRVPAGSVLAINYDVTFDVGAMNLIDAQRVKDPRGLGHIHRAWLDLLGGRMRNGETSVVVGDVLVTVVAALSEALLEAVALVD